MARLSPHLRLLVALPLVLIALSLAVAQQAGSGSAERGSEPATPGSGSAERGSGAAERPPAETPGDLAPARNMNNRLLGELLAKHFAAYKLEGGGGAWRVDLTVAAPGDPLAEAPEGPAPEAEAPHDPEGDPFAPDLGGKLGDDPDGKPAGDQKAEGPGAGERLPANLIVVTDELANRMRIMIPIRRFDPDRLDDLRLMLIAMHANYDRALDARYAVQGGVLWSVFIHPLGSLTEQDLTSAIQQVRTLRKNTGTSYSSGGLLFGGAGPRQPPPVDPGDVI